jgi:ribonuclease-3
LIIPGADLFQRRWKRAEISPELQRKLRSFERIIRHRFRRPDLLRNALKHRSYLDFSGEPRCESNERLEFLGDAVLNLLVSEHFFRSSSHQNEGELTAAKSTIVSGTVLSEQARKIHLGNYLFISENEEKTGGRDRDSILEDAFEALIGAIYLDRGLEAARSFISRFLLVDSGHILNERSLRNYKSILQEYAQKRGGEPPEYTVVKETGPDHNKRFVVEVSLGGKVIGRGKGKTKKEAEQHAAADGIRKSNLNLK